MTEKAQARLLQPRSDAGPHSRILGIGAYRPRRVVRNAELARVLGRTPKWMESRSGIQERRFASPDETLAMMGAEAARKALAHASVPARDIDLVLLASTSNMLRTPPTAVVIGYELGAQGAAAFDLSAACAGFCHAVGVASDAVRSESARNVLVIGAERMTDIVNGEDQEISFLFADGAGAVVIGPSELAGIGPVVRGADASYYETPRMRSTWAAGPAAQDRPWLRMNGPSVFRWVMQEVGTAAARAMDSVGIGPGELGAFIPHQANLRMIDLMSQRLGISTGTAVSRDVVRAGNTSSASVPLAMEAMLAANQAASGDSALILGFGAGLNYAGQVVLLP
jgi:3-oxoacyl-(acyl-carrier-protein) synthase III